MHTSYILSVILYVIHLSSLVYFIYSLSFLVYVMYSPSSLYTFLFTCTLYANFSRVRLLFTCTLHAYFSLAYFTAPIFPTCILHLFFFHLYTTCCFDVISCHIMSPVFLVTILYGLLRICILQVFCSLTHFTNTIIPLSGIDPSNLDFKHLLLTN